MTALWISFCFAVIPPIIGALFVPETLGMRQIDFNEEKREERINKALSKEGEEDDDHSSSFGGKILAMLSGDNNDKNHQYQDQQQQQKQDSPVPTMISNTDYVEMTGQEQNNASSGYFV